MADTRTTIRIDSVGADKVKRDYADITAANDKAAAGFQKTGEAASKAGDGFEKLGRNTRDYAAHAKVASTSSHAVGIGLATLAKYASAAALIEMGRRTILSADAYNVLQGRIREATRATGDYSTVSQQLFSISQTTGTALENNVALFQRMATGAREFGATSSEILQVTKTIQQLGIIGGASASSMAAGTTQFAQAMAAGVVRAEEWNSIVENMPEVAVGIASALGMSVGELRKMVVDGKLLSEDVFGALQKQAEDVQKRFEAMPVSIERAGQRLSDAWSAAAAGTDAVSGTTTAIVEGMERLADILPAIVSGVNAMVQGILNAVDYADRGLGISNSAKIANASDALDKAKGRKPDFFDRLGIPSNQPTAAAIESAQQEFSDALVAAAKDAMADATAGISRLQGDKPDFARDGLANAKIALPDEKAIAKAAAAAEKAAKAQEDAVKAVDKAYEDHIKTLMTAQQRENDYYEKVDEGNAAQEERRQSIEDTIAAIEAETAMIGLSNEAKEKAIALRNLEKGGASPDQLGRAGAEIDAQQAKQAAQDAADEVQAVWDKARDEFSDSWSDLFYGIFADGKLRFKDLADSFKNIWARTLADLLTMSIQNSFIKPMFDGLFGGAGSGTGAGGAVGVFGSLGASLLGGGRSSSVRGSAAWMDENIYGPSGNGAGGIGGFFGKPMGASTIGGVLGGAAMGAGAGKMTGSAQAGAVGGAIGMAVAGPIGALIGGLVFGAVAGLFKSTPKSISSYGTGGIADSMASGGLDVKIGKDMATGVIRALKSFSDQLVTGIESDEFLGIVGQRGKKFFYQAQETDLKVAGKKRYGAEKFDTAEEAIAAAIEAAINSGVVKGLTDADKALMRAATSVQEAMADVVSSHNFKRELDFQFLGLSSPLKEAQARLEFEYQQQLILAEKYEADKTKLEAIYAQKRLDLVEQYNSQQYASLKSFLTSITAGSASPLSPTTRLGLASANYSALSGRARSGDQDAIAALQGAAQDYLSAGRDVFASGGGYQSIYQQVVADLSSITGVANPLGVGAAANQNVAAAVNDNTRAQAGWFTQAAAQRTATNAKLDTLNTNVSALVTALSRGTATPTQSGTVQVGTIDWASVTQAVASLR